MRDELKDAVADAKMVYALQGQKCDRAFIVIDKAINGTSEQPGLKERIGKAEGTLRWQWVAIGGAFAFAAFLLSEFLSHVMSALVMFP